MKKNHSLKIMSAFALLMAAFAIPLSAAPVIINFDTGSDAPFLHANPVVVPVVPKSICGGGAGFEPGLVGSTTYTYPGNLYPNGGATNRGYRLQCVSAPTNHFTQCALGVPTGSTDALLGRTFSYATNVYTNFFCQVDMINWDDNLNQVPGLLARIKDVTAGSFGNGLGAVDGYAMTWEALEDGDGSGDRLGGAMIIYKVSNEVPGGTAVVGASSVTLRAGHGYRLTFSGTNLSPVLCNLTGQIYDLEDLTTPVMSITAQESGSGTNSFFPSGVCGLLSFTRSYGSPTDVTYDNYYSDEMVDPDAAIAPARKIAIAGTPQVDTRSPASRDQNFWPTASGISFTVKTFNGNPINDIATKLYLNGVDNSASLVAVPGAPGNSSYSTPVSPLVANTVYSARIEVQDLAGVLKSTNTFWFDTFTDAYLLSGYPVKTIEAEDYNYSNGVYQLDPIAVSGQDSFGGDVPAGGGPPGYYKLPGNGTNTNPDVDYSITEGGVDGTFKLYRTVDRIRTAQGAMEEITDLTNPAPLPPGTPYPNDGQRSQYVAAAGGAPGIYEYVVNRMRVGTWMNYTRDFGSATNYNVYLRCGSFGIASVQLDFVNSSPTTPGQTTTRLGQFDVANHHVRYNFRYEPLLANCQPAVISLSGTNTIRLTQLGSASRQDRLLDLNYVLLVPTSAAVTPPVTLESTTSLTPLAVWAPESGASYNVNNSTITVAKSGDVRFYRLKSCNQASTITSTTIAGNNVIMKY